MHDLKNYDIFNSKLLIDATYEGIDEFPIIKGTDEIPSSLTRFSDCTNKKLFNPNSTVMFYEHDTKFEKAWKNPDRYLPFLKDFKNVVSPDFSMYRNMPLILQKWSHFKSHALAHYFEQNGITVIPNVRWSDENSYDFFMLGIPKRSTISIGTHGCVKAKEDKYFFQKGLDLALSNLDPSVVIIYGTMPDEIFEQYLSSSTQFIQFDSIYSQTHKRGK